jgi:hypothetical protein
LSTPSSGRRPVRGKEVVLERYGQFVAEGQVAPGRVAGMHHLADGLEGIGDHAAARATAQEALSIAQAVGDRCVTVRALIGLGRESYALAEPEAADAFLAEAMSVSRRDGRAAAIERNAQRYPYPGGNQRTAASAA